MPLVNPVLAYFTPSIVWSAGVSAAKWMVRIDIRTDPIRQRRPSSGRAYGTNGWTHDEAAPA